MSVQYAILLNLIPFILLV